MDYIIASYVPSPRIEVSKGEVDYFFLQYDIYRKRNQLKRDEFVQKLMKAKLNHGLKALDSLPREAFYDLRLSMGLTNQEIYRAYDVSKSTLNRLGLKNNVFCDVRQFPVAIEIGVREIDVDKFVEYLTKR